jgi:hypothetical protein
VALQYEALTRQTADSLDWIKTAEQAVSSDATAAATRLAHGHRSFDTLEDTTVESVVENVERRLAVTVSGAGPIKLRPLQLREVRERSLIPPLALT